MTVKVKAGQACFKQGAVVGELVCARKGMKLAWAAKRR